MSKGNTYRENNLSSYAFTNLGITKTAVVAGEWAAPNVAGVWAAPKIQPRTLALLCCCIVKNLVPYWLVNEI
jgi:hypothetical protein